MIRTLILCDMCERPLPIDTLADGTKYVKRSRTKEWDTRHVFPHLCETCALKIDNALLKFKNDVAHERGLAAKFKKINDERKERLGTNG